MKPKKDKRETSINISPSTEMRRNEPVPLPWEEQWRIEKKSLAFKEKEERKRRKRFFDSLHCYPLIQLLGGFDGLGELHYRPSKDGQVIEVALCRWVDGEDHPRDWSFAERHEYFRDDSSDEFVAKWMALCKMQDVRPAGWVNYTRWYPLTNEGLKEFALECNYLMDRRRFLYVCDVGQDVRNCDDDWETMEKELRRRENSQRGRENVEKARAAGKKIGRPRKAK